jgi:hypothetical protein
MRVTVAGMEKPERRRVPLAGLALIGDGAVLGLTRPAAPGPAPDAPDSPAPPLPSASGSVTPPPPEGPDSAASRGRRGTDVR